MSAKSNKKLVLNPSWCKGCGICAAFCPKHALEIMDEKVRRVPDAECILCGQCELRCPDYAIYIDDEQEGEVNQWVKSY